jgi:hypothetical protein
MLRLKAMHCMNSGHLLKFVKNNLYTIIGAVDVVDSKESFQEDRYLLQISVIFDIVLH